MCDRSRLKRRAYCYSTKKIKSIASSKWERQIPREKDYWNDFCQKEKSKLIVRNPRPNLIHSSLNHKYPFDLDYAFPNNDYARSIDDKIDRFIRDRKPLAKSQFNIPSFELESFSRENDIDSITEPVFPAITVMSSTLPEKPTKTFSSHEKSFEQVSTENVSFGTELSSEFSTSNQNNLSEDIRNRKIYSRKSCPFHRNEPPTRIFDDDIERCLMGSNRREKANVDKRIISRKDEAVFVKKTCKMCQKKMKNCTSKSIEKHMDDVKLSADLNSNQGNSELDSRISISNDAESEYILKTIENEVDNIKLSDDPNSNRESLTPISRIPKLNDADLKRKSDKLLVENANDFPCASNLQTMTRDKDILTIPNLPETKRKRIPENKSEKLTMLPKYMKKRRKSLDVEYYLRYAYKALKCVTSNKKLCLDPKTYETRNETSPSSEKCEKHSVNVSTSLRSIASFDLELGDHSKDHTGSLDNFLNKLPKLSCLPRKSHDRCLPCLHKSVNEIIESEVKNTYKITKRRTPMQNVSIDSDSSDITLPELDQSQIENYEKITECDISNKKFDSADTYKMKEEIPKLHGITSVDGVKEMKQRPIDSKLELKTSEDKGIDFKRISGLSERSKSSSSCSSPDEDESSTVYLEDNSKSSKYRVPCHVPTVLCPSLEPLRALRMKKSTSLQSRVASDEPAMMSTIEARDNIISTTSETKQQGKLPSKDSKSETDSVPHKKILTKVKSASGNLIAESEDITREKKGTLRRGSSCVNLETILRDFASDTKLESLVEDDLEKSSQSRFLFSTEEIEEVLKDHEERNSSTINILTTLCDMFLNRVLESNSIDKRRVKLIRRLVKLLVDSRRYLNPSKFPSDLSFSSQFSNQRPVLNANRLRKILPLDSYNLIAPLLGIPEYYPRIPFDFHRTQSPITLARKHRFDKSDSSQETGDDLIVHPPSEKVDTILHHELQATQCNPYALFMKKERRKAVTWRPLEEDDLKGYDPEATLRMRADKITMKICRDFCKWLRSLGGAERDVNETVLKDMFEISFSADACKATQISVKEMATVPTDVASARLCYGSSVLAMTRKQLYRDIKAETKPKCVLAFNTSMPTDLLYIPPTNRVREKWLECKSVPRDLETMDTVWNGIKDLDSVKGFLQWFRHYPEVSPPETLTEPTHPKRRSTRFAKKKSEVRKISKMEETNVQLQEQETTTQTA